MINEEDELSVRIPFLSGNNFPIQGTNAQYANLNVTPIAHTIRGMATELPKPKVSVSTKAYCTVQINCLPLPRF